MSSWKELKDNPKIKEYYITRTKIVRSIREFFWKKDFLETDTPVALRLSGQEPYLNPLSITIHNPNKEPFLFFLHTSPEFAMKKLLAAGFSHIFQITKCFRDEESFGGNHNTEFTMTEWYRAPGSLTQIMDDTEQLFRYIGQQVGILKLKFQQHSISLAEPWDRKTMKEVWQEYIGVNLDEYLTVQSLRQLVVQKGLEAKGKETYEDLFFTIFLNFIEPHLGLVRPVYIYDYPRQMCSLSRVTLHDSRYAERFELYIGGLEIANAFGELMDANEQKQRLLEDRNLREKLGKQIWDIDEDFITALRSGIPDAAGIALGVDRVVMLFTGAQNIEQVLFQSIGDQLHF